MTEAPFYTPWLKTYLYVTLEILKSFYLCYSNFTSLQLYKIFYATYADKTKIKAGEVKRILIILPLQFFNIFIYIKHLQRQIASY